MRRQHDQGAVAHEVSVRAVDRQVSLRVARDSTVVLLVAGVAEEDDALDLVDDGGRKSGYRSRNDGCTLAVAS